MGALRGFSGGSDCKESTCNAGDRGSIPGLGRSSGAGNGHPLQYSGLENSMDRGAWLARVHGLQSWTQLSFKNLRLQQTVPRLVRIDLDVVFFNFVSLKWPLSGSSYIAGQMWHKGFSKGYQRTPSNQMEWPFLNLTLPAVSVTLDNADHLSLSQHEPLALPISLTMPSLKW